MSSLLRYFVLFGLRAYSFGILDVYVYCGTILLVVDHGDSTFIDENILELCYSFVYRELVQFTGETLSVFTSRCRPYPT